jgi:acyl dehydratase
MLTMARATAVLTDWIGDPSRLASCEARFARPVVVPDDDHGVVLTVTVDVLEAGADGSARVSMVAAVGDQVVLVHAHALVRPPL